MGGGTSGKGVRGPGVRHAVGPVATGPPTAQAAAGAVTGEAWPLQGPSVPDGHA